MKIILFARVLTIKCLNSYFIHACILTLLFCFSSSAMSEPYQSLQSIRTAVVNFLEQHNDPELKHKISVGRLDKRMHLSTCDQPLETFIHPGSKTSGSTTVGVRCATPKAWSLYVPATVKIFKQILATSQPLPRGKAISPGDFHVIEKEISPLNSGYYVRAENIIGKITKRALPSDYIFTPNSIQAPKLVLRGEDVSIILKTNAFSIRTKGEALMDGAANDKIKVRNKASKKVLEAIVTERGVVSVRM